MAQLKGFWSYVHADDAADDGRIVRLAKDVAAEFEMLTDEKIDQFLDKDAISWGKDWRNKLDDSLASIAFFIPVLTVRYFRSFECRRELQYFARRATSLGIEELVLPLLYVDVAQLHEDIPSDDLVALVKRFQWEDWRQLRFADLGSGDYRRGVARLAERLVEANMKAEEANVASAASALESSVEDASDDSPGLLDQLATTEETLPQLKTTVEDIGQEIELIGQIMQDAAADMERGTSQGKGFAARLAVARRVSQEMREPAERVWSFGNDFASQLHQVDAGIRAMIEGGAIEARESPVSLAGLCTFFDSVRELSNSVDEGLSGIQSMIEAISPVEAMSRDLRDPLRRLRQGLTLMLEAREVAGEWVKLIEDTGIDCDDVADESSS